MMGRKTKILIALSITTIAFLVLRQCPRTETGKRFFLDNDTLNAGIGINPKMFTQKGDPIGFNYTLLGQYAECQGCIISIDPPFSDENYWEMLINKEIDVLVIDNVNDSIPAKYADDVKESIPINQTSVWVVRDTDKKLLRNINLWLSHYMQKGEYETLSKRFFRSYKTKKNLENSTKTDVISPYDLLIKRHSTLLGWDWRLLAALIHKESNFSMGAQSPRGAVGLMQIKESTAEHYGVSDVFNPDNNIKAGVLHLKYLQKIFLAEGMDSANIVKFTLAAYNAGEGRMEDCLNFAVSLGKNHRDWESVAAIIPLMKESTYYNSNIIKCGKFNGTETIKYVDEVLSKYDEYLLVIKH